VVDRSASIITTTWAKAERQARLMARVWAMARMA
jgi:hypothetical protein